MIDVCLLLEGTYPYVAGGVSTWVHQLVSAMQGIKFGIVYIAAHSDPTRRVKYNVPDNVIYLKDVYLHDYDLDRDRSRRARRSDYDILARSYEDLLNNRQETFGDFLSLFQGQQSCLDTSTVFQSKEIWHLLENFYGRIGTDISFLDYFWTWRGTHLPLVKVLKTKLPQARIYHSVSTGYAGLLGAMASVQNMGRYFLTEHGIYTHERMLEISQASWIYEKEKHQFRAARELSFFKKWWIRMFQVMSSLSYFYADRIFTLFEGNKLRQSLEGAQSNKITVIPNGVDLSRFASVVREKKPGFHVGFIGRVVTIKDVKTFIYAAKAVLDKGLDAEFYIMGPTDEEEDYYQECLNLVEGLGLDKVVKFTGRVNILEYLSFLDVVVLTSLSEAQPYVILEANAVGVPIVATDVGSCREMVDGTTPEDRRLGPSGLITKVSAPQETAEAILQLANNKDLWDKMSAAGKKRVYRFYDQDDLLSRYLNVYEQNL